MKEPRKENLRSMTGYAVETADISAGQLSLELRAVNSRFLDLAFRMGEDFRALEPALRERIAERVRRGKLECRVNFAPREDVALPANLNAALLDQLKTLASAAQAALPGARALGVAEILRWPGMLGDDGVGFEQIQPQIAPLLAAALEDLVASRRREGEKLADMIRGRIAHMRDLVARVQPRVPALVAEYQEKLAQRLRDASATLDDDRIRLEVGLFAQRVDVAEELSRLSTHLDEVERILKSGGTAGKRLDFLMQELNREANTLGSKAMAADMTAIAVELKLAIEQMREQVQNIE